MTNPHVTLRPYQEEAVAALRDAHAKRINGVVVAGVGAGKTTILSEFMRQIRAERSLERTLVVVHRIELVEQIIERLIKHGGIPKNQIGMFGAGKSVRLDAPIVVAMIQSAQAKKMKVLKELFSHGPIDNLVVDEAHHAVAANTYGALREALTNNMSLARPDGKVWLLGLTATPNRHDEKGLDTFFHNGRAKTSRIIYKCGTQKLIEMGYLCTPVRIRHNTKINTSDLRSSGKDSDFSARALSQRLGENNWAAEVYNAYMQHARPVGKTIVFMPEVKQSLELVELLCKAGVQAAHVDGTTDKDTRRQTVSDFRDGKLEVMSNVGVFTEGFDVPDTRVILLARPTRSKPLYEQMVGRGLRLAEGKPHATIIEMIVSDGKLTEARDLFGMMVPCTECGAEFMLGSANCPHCGANYRTSLKSLDLAHADLMPPDIAQLAQEGYWPHYVDGAGRLSFSRGFDDAVIAVPLESNLGDEAFTAYKVYEVKKPRNAPKTEVWPLGKRGRHEIADILKSVPALPTNGETWGKMMLGAASAAQAKFLSALWERVNTPEAERHLTDLSKADVSRLITHWNAVAMVNDYIESRNKA